MELEVRDLSVSIDKRVIIQNVSARVGSRRFVGIVGPNGSGKSTLLKTIYRALKPSSGVVLLDGKSLTDIPLKESARRLGVMTQMSTLNFDFRVEEVVLMGRTPHKKLMETDSDEDYALAHKALELVGMAELAGRKFNTLSGGERQRISIARAFLKDAPIILLDEATASLDVENETLIQSALSRLIKNKTVLVIAHRMRTVAGADKIVVLADGSVAEQGAPEELYQRDGIYSHMVNLQMESQNWALE